MKKIDILLAIICGLAISWIGNDFFKNFGWIIIIVLPILSVIILYLLSLVGEKIPFAYQIGKFGLAGGFASLVDIKVFQLLFLFAPFSLTIKAVSFIAGTFVKYFFDKHWTFQGHKKEGMPKEMAKFFIVATAGMLLNVTAFYFFNKANIGISANLWTELSIILAAICAGLWNFLGYKFIVFKK